MTDEREQRSTRETTKTKAERIKAKWEAELCESQYKPASITTWAKLLLLIWESTDLESATVVRNLHVLRMPCSMNGNRFEHSDVDVLDGLFKKAGMLVELIKHLFCVLVFRPRAEFVVGLL